MVWISLPKNELVPNPEKVNKKRKNRKFEKKSSQGISLRNICTKFGGDWKIFRYRNYDTTSVTHTKRSKNQGTHNHTITQSQTYMLLVILLFRWSKKLRKIVSAQSKKITQFVRIT